MSDDDHDLWTLIALLGHKQHRQHRATRAGEIRTRLAAGADPDAGREAPLLLAARMGYRDIAEALLEGGADVHGGHRYLTPLQAAGSRVELRELLLAHGAEDTPFSLLACGDVDRVAEVLAADPSWATKTDEVDKTLLFSACARQDLAIMERLLDAGADPGVVATGSHGIAPIHEVVRSDEGRAAAAIALLRSRGADLDAGDKGGVTALHMAVRDRDLDAVIALLAEGAAVDVEDRGRKSTALRRAVANTGRSGTSGKADVALAIVRLLLKHGADPMHVNRAGKPVIASTRNADIRKLLAEHCPAE
jgi:ankyrin repeat protein